MEGPKAPSAAGEVGGATQPTVAAELGLSSLRTLVWVGTALVALNIMVATGVTHGLDTSLRLTLWQEQPQLDQQLKAAEFVLDRYITLVLLLASAGLTWLWRGRHLGIRACLAVAIGWCANMGLTTILKLTTGRGRARLDQLQLFDFRHVQLIDTAQKRLMATYPSGHSGGAALAAMCTWYLATSWPKRPRRWFRGAGAVIVVVTCILSWLRTTHWTTDLIAGVLTGWIAAAAGVVIAARLRRVWRYVLHHGDVKDAADGDASAVERPRASA